MHIKSVRKSRVSGRIVWSLFYRSSIFFFTAGHQNLLKWTNRPRGAKKKISLSDNIRIIYVTKIK